MITATTVLTALRSQLAERGMPTQEAMLSHVGDVTWGVHIKPAHPFSLDDLAQVAETVPSTHEVHVTPGWVRLRFDVTAT